MNEQYPSGEPQKKSGSKWPLFIILGCIGVPVLCGGGGLVLFYGIFAAANASIKSTTAYTESVTKATNNPEVQAALGTPITENTMTNAHINVVNDAGDADFVVPLTGPKGSGTLRVVAKKAGGKWTCTTQDFEGGGKTINLMTAK